MLPSKCRPGAMSPRLRLTGVWMQVWQLTAHHTIQMRLQAIIPGI